MIALVLTSLLRGVRTHRSLVLENLALRHQLAVLQRTAPCPRLRRSDRVFWVLLSRLWRGWAETVSMVRPDTVIRWQRTGFGLFWTWKSRRHGPGRPAVAPEVRALIRRMSEANPLWGAPRIHGERQKLGLEISQATVSKCLVRRRTPPSQSWRTFLANHVGSLVSVDFFIVPTVMFKVLFVFVVRAHDRRRVVHVNVTDAPTAQWTAQQLVEAFPWETAPRYLLRDRDAVYGVVFSRRVHSRGIHDVKIAPRSPWQTPCVERLIGTLRRDCLDHVVVLSPRYGRAGSLLITADAGGSNGSRVRLWKWELQQLATRTGLAITVCHFPPGTSTWNTIEHRLFSLHQHQLARAAPRESCRDRQPDRCHTHRRRAARAV